MDTLIARSGLRSAAAGAKRFSLKRSFASSAHHDEEAAKWEKITYAGIATCIVLAIFDLSRGHHEFPDPPVSQPFGDGTHIFELQPYPYLHIRNKDFPWGPDGLFEKKKKHADH